MAGRTRRAAAQLQGDQADRPGGAEPGSAGRLGHAAAAGPEPGPGHSPRLGPGREAGPDRVRELRRAPARRGQERRASGGLARFALTVRAWSRLDGYGPGFRGEGCEVVMPERHVVIPKRKRSWRKRAPWWIWCTIGPQIHHEARINHDDYSNIRINIRNL